MIMPKLPLEVGALWQKPEARVPHYQTKSLLDEVPDLVSYNGRLCSAHAHASPNAPDLPPHRQTARSPARGIKIVTSSFVLWMKATRSAQRCRHCGYCPRGWHVESQGDRCSDVGLWWQWPTVFLVGNHCLPIDFANNCENRGRAECGSRGICEGE